MAATTVTSILIVMIQHLSKPDIIGVPYGARLEQVVLYHGEVHVWMAIKCRPDKYEDWQGTYLRIERNGRVTRVTQDDAYDYDQEFLIKKGE